MNPAEMMFTLAAVSGGISSGTVLSAAVPLRTAATTKTGTLTMNGLQAGSGILVCVSQYIGVMTSVVGSLNGAYTKAYGAEDGGDNGMEYFYFRNSAAGNETITITAAATAGETYLCASAIEIAGLGAVDKSGFTFNGPTVTATAQNLQAKMFVVCGGTWDSGGNAAFTPPTGYTLIDRENNADTNSATIYAYKVVNALETSTATIGSSNAAFVDSAIHSIPQTNKR